MYLAAQQENERAARRGQAFAQQSNPRVPRISISRTDRTFAVADILQRIDQGNARQEFHALVAELTCHTQTQRRAVWGGEIIAVQSVGQERLRMISVGQIERVPHTVV